MQTNIVLSARETAQKKYSNARGNLLLMIILTVVNIVLLISGSNSMMLFSATIPYGTIGMGMYSEDSVIMMVCAAIAAVIIAAYVLCWIFSKKHVVCMIVALVLFSIDTVVLAGLYLLVQDISGILDMIIHIWVMYYLIVGILYGYKLKNMPADEPRTEVSDAPIQAGVETEGTNTSVLRMADMDVKARILLEAEELGHWVCYRRVKRINELVIDGRVYDDVEMLIETAHVLSAKLDGHVFQVGYDGALHSYLRVDGETVLRKLRFW